jgi:hypothetical protein
MAWVLMLLEAMTDAQQPSESGGSSPLAEAPASRSPHAARLWQLLGSIAIVAWACLRFPHTTLTQSLDPSWTAVLMYARENGLQFGRDIVFTYGPLGFL